LAVGRTFDEAERTTEQPAFVYAKQLSAAIHYSAAINILGTIDFGEAIEPTVVPALLLLPSVEGACDIGVGGAVFGAIGVYCAFLGTKWQAEQSAITRSVCE
jgi:uncharacterized membrane protein